MKYFLIGTDEKNRNPYNINKNRALDIRKLTGKALTRCHGGISSVWTCQMKDFSRI